MTVVSFPDFVVYAEDGEFIVHQAAPGVVRVYTTFRSLIASCALHGLNPQEYLEQVLRLAPHWPITRMLELAPKYWAKTKVGLDARQRAIVARPWETADAVPEMVAALARAA